MQRTLERWGGLDIVYANAGVNGVGLVVDLSEAEWDRVIEADLDSVFYTLRAAVPAIKRSPHGRVICTASHYGVIGKENMASYSAAKGGVIGLMRSVALEIGRYGATANAVAPGPVQTGIMHRTAEQIEDWKARLPLGRLGEPEDVAGVVLFLASDLSSWVTGHVLQVNGGAFLQ